MLKCDIYGKIFQDDNLIAGQGVRHEIESLIQFDFPNRTDINKICREDYDLYKIKYVSKIIEDEKGDIQELKKDVLNSINDNELITSNSLTFKTEILTIGDNISDKVATFGGRSPFIGSVVKDDENTRNAN